MLPRDSTTYLTVLVPSLSFFTCAISLCLQKVSLDNLSVSLLNSRNLKDAPIPKKESKFFQLLSFSVVAAVFWNASIAWSYLIFIRRTTFPGVEAWGA